MEQEATALACVSRGREVAGGDDLLEEVAEASFAGYGIIAARDEFDTSGVNVATDDVVAAGGELGGDGETDAANADDGDVHGRSWTVATSVGR